MHKLIERIKVEWDNNPLTVVVVGTLAVTALAKFVDAMSAAQGRRAYAKQVNYRVKR